MVTLEKGQRSALSDEVKDKYSLGESESGVLLPVTAKFARNIFLAHRSA